MLGIAEFRKSKTTIDPVRIANASALVTSGVFRITRNPMYVGLTALLLAWGVVLDAPATLAFPFVFAAFLNRFQIIPEERAMTNRFGEAYLVYCRRVRRWL
ncbi:MAG: isoprenylcysteine carboxylmethyltransferase family protein [Polyangiaceae bacterium]